LARERSVSVATVLQAYFELENEGLVEVRLKSGHFVRRERGPELLEPSTPRRSSVPSEITVSAAVAALVALALAGGGAHEVEAQVHAQATEWAQFIFSSSEELDQLATQPTTGGAWRG
jgi:DNA-binding transcriptional MocR family regulator